MAIHKNNKYKIFKPNSLFCNNKNIRNASPKLPACSKLPALTVAFYCYYYYFFLKYTDLQIIDICFIGNSNEKQLKARSFYLAAGAKIVHLKNSDARVQALQRYARESTDKASKRRILIQKVFEVKWKSGRKPVNKKRKCVFWHGTPNKNVPKIIMNKLRVMPDDGKPNKDIFLLNCAKFTSALLCTGASEKTFIF
jgi:hypothetical protein